MAKWKYTHFANNTCLLLASLCATVRCCTVRTFSWTSFYGHKMQREIMGASNKWKMKMDTWCTIIVLNHCEVLMHVACVRSRCREKCIVFEMNVVTIIFFSFLLLDSAIASAQQAPAYSVSPFAHLLIYSTQLLDTVSDSTCSLTRPLFPFQFPLILCGLDTLRYSSNK